MIDYLALSIMFKIKIYTALGDQAKPEKSEPDEVWTVSGQIKTETDIMYPNCRQMTNKWSQTGYFFKEEEKNHSF